MLQEKMAQAKLAPEKKDEQAAPAEAAAVGAPNPGSQV
jgi:hypothetical protein